MPSQPANRQAVLESKLDALVNQLERLNDFYKTQEDKVKAQPAILRQQQDQTWEALGTTPLLVPKNRPKDVLEDPVYRDYGGERGLQQQQDKRLPPSPPKLRDRYQQLRNDGGGRWGSLRSALGSYSPQQSQGSSMPPNSSGGGGGMMTGLGIGGMGSTGMNDPIMPWLMMGGDMHGAPGVVRNLAMRQWGFNKSVDWASQAGGSLQDYIQNNPDSMTASVLGGNKAQTVLGGAQGALGWASQNRTAAFAGALAAGGTFRTIGKISSGMSNMRDIGELMGYQSYGGGSSWMGFHNPLRDLPTNPAVQEGLAFEAEKQRLMGRLPGHDFGGGLTKDQATQVLDVLANQGWHQDRTTDFGSLGKGDASTIAEGLMGPLMKKFPGLSAQDLGQFTDHLRYGATSTQDLVQALGDLGAQAKSTQQTIGQVTGSIKSYAEATRSQGGSSVAGMTTATGFTAETGMNPQLLGQAIQNPFVQGMGVAQGIMPWQLGETGVGANAALGMGVQRLMSATSGLAQDRQMMDQQTGKMITVSGKESQLDFVAQRLGWTREQLQGYLKNQTNQVNRRRVLEDLGQEGTPGNTFYNLTKGASGLSGINMTPQQNQKAQQEWMQTVVPDLKRAGVSDAQIKQLSNEGFKKRIEQTKTLLTQQAGKEMNKAQSSSANTTNVKVTVGLTGEAARLFKVQGKPSIAKQTTNAGGAWNGHQSISEIVNSAEGDMTAQQALVKATGRPIIGR